MTPGPGQDGSEKSIGEIVSEVSEKASLLVREEIALAKAEISSKVKTLGKGTVVGIVAGTFLVFAFVVFLEAMSWFFNDLLDVTTALWAGFLITALILTVLAAICGFLAYRWLRTGPPTPDMAIEQARITRQTLEHQGIERDQLERSVARDKTEEDS